MTTKLLEEIEIEVFYKPGNGRMYCRDALPITHPEHLYNYVKNTFNIAPEDYGIFDPRIEKHKEKSWEELAHLVCELEEQVNSLERFLASV